MVKITKSVSAETRNKYVRVVWNSDDSSCEIDCAAFHVIMDADTLELLQEALQRLYPEKTNGNLL